MQEDKNDIIPNEMLQDVCKETKLIIVLSDYLSSRTIEENHSKLQLILGIAEQLFCRWKFESEEEVSKPLENMFRILSTRLSPNVYPLLYEVKYKGLIKILTS